MMKTLIQKKMPIRKIFKNLFHASNAETPLPQNHSNTPTDKSELPTPQPITDTTEHLMHVEIHDTFSVHHVEIDNMGLNDLDTWSPQIENLSDIMTEDLPQYLALSRVLREQLDTIPECQAVAYVNISSNQLLAFETRQSWAEAVQPLIAAATSDLFLAPNTAKMINAFRKLREKSFDEVNYHQIIISADNVTYVLLRAQNRRDRVAVFACRDSVALGMVLHHAHHALPKIEAAEDSPD